MSKRNIYLTLTAICLLLIVTIQGFYKEVPLSEKQFNLSLSRDRLMASPFVIPIVLFSLIYLLIFLIGILQIFYFLIAKTVQKQPVLVPTQVKAIIVLPEEKAGKILFLTSFSVLFFYIAPSLFYVFEFHISAIALLLMLNMLLEATVIAVLLSHVNWKLFGFQIKKSALVFLLQIYCAMLPFLLVAMLINGFLLKKMGIEYEPSAAVALLLAIKNPLLLTILILQIIGLGPLAEELFFRGFLFSLCRARYGFMLSAGLISFFFSVLHRTPANILPLFVISFSLCYLYEKTQSIAAVATFHALHNRVSLIGFFLIKNLITY